MKTLRRTVEKNDNTNLKKNLGSYYAELNMDD